ncbi:MAG: hypothetical protein AAES65_03275 [Candidatus Thiodiazotropha sp. (ex. Lucinoma kazani)]
MNGKINTFSDQVDFAIIHGQVDIHIGILFMKYPECGENAQLPKGAWNAETQGARGLYPVTAILASTSDNSSSIWVQ